MMSSGLSSLVEIADLLGATKQRTTRSLTRTDSWIRKPRTFEAGSGIGGRSLRYQAEKPWGYAGPGRCPKEPGSARQTSFVIRSGRCSKK
jgi:hypothetical protein